ncbi:MAG: hypothetical protein DCC49_02880 [Acidobacteria bacterium]|nr:MAG: hypothetical protein DCC49_02880 [Acidobacteriota bacterium]
MSADTRQGRDGYKKKLIEVALPLEAINRESAREKSIRHGHPSTLHLWWSRKPLATCRAVLFASLVDDPSSRPDEFPTEEAQETERKRLFGIIEELVKWENSNNDEVLKAARAEIERSTDGNPPPVLDPFCGGGSIPLEAQRLGLEAHGSDLNPVAVLITKALIEIPPRFAGCAPVHPAEGQGHAVEAWKGAEGLAEDIRYYGAWMRDQAEERIGDLYPKAKLPKEHGGGEATVIAWIWARTVTCPNPACGAEMPLTNKWWLSTKKGKKAWVEPQVDRATKSVAFEVHTGSGTAPDGTVDRRGARCVICDSPVPFDHVRSEGRAGRMGARLMAIVAEGNRQRVYLSPDEVHEEIATRTTPPDDVPDADLPHNPRDFKTPNYGRRKFRDLFTDRQLVALTTFSDLVGEARERVLADAIAAGMADDNVPLHEGGSGATAYADALATYLAFAVDRCADYWGSIATWHASNQQVRCTFARQAIPMTWDYVEANPFSNSSGGWDSLYLSTVDAFGRCVEGPGGAASQLDAARVTSAGVAFAVSTDPPYYDNIGYADLADYFYIWLRRSLKDIWPQEFSTLLVPKAQELVATPYRFDGDREMAEEHFETGLGQAFKRIREESAPGYPTTVFYAFKQSESEGESTASTGWETMLEGLIRAGFSIDGTWPMRSEQHHRMIARDANALASSIVLVCRPRADDAPLATRKEFLAALKAELPQALKLLQHGNIAPVDLAQAAIGPGMSVFTRHSRVVEADGSNMTVRTALALINQVLDETLAEQEADFDKDTRWALAWFEQYGHDEGPFGVAETLSKAKNTSVSGLVEAGVLESAAGKVRLLRREELADDWDPITDGRRTVWEVAQHLIRALEGGGESAAADLLRKVGGLGETARELAYRLYQICEKKKWAQEAISYNALVVAWPEITRIASSAPAAAPEAQQMEI